MNVLVTGGTGYLGRAVVRALAARGHTPVVFSRSASRSGLPGRLVDGDVRDVRAVAHAMAGCAAVVHMAALVSIWRRRAADFDDVNVGGLQHVLAGAAASNVSRIVYTSSFLALPPAGCAHPLTANDYQRTKVAAERVVAAHVRKGAPIVRVYPGVLYGPGAPTEGNLVGRLLRDLASSRLPGLVGGARLWSFSHVDDVAAGHCAALERGEAGAQYALGGENVPQRLPFDLAADLLGRRRPREFPPALAAALGWIEQWRAAITGRHPRLTRGTVEIFRHDWPLDSRAAVADLGYAITPLDAGLRATLESIAGSGAAPTAAGARP